MGCCSSTYQPPWTEDGCGHWGLLVVALSAQGTGVATQLVAAAERRLAANCHEVQMEYEYTAGQAYSERLMEWYEGKCGFTCVNAPRRRSRGHGETEFRKCRKELPEAARSAARRAHLTSMRALVAADLAEAEAAAAQEEEEEEEGGSLMGARVVLRNLAHSHTRGREGWARS